MEICQVEETTLCLNFRTNNFLAMHNRKSSVLNACNINVSCPKGNDYVMHKLCAGKLHT